MRAARLTASIVLAAALGAAAPAFAQRASLAERVAAIEQQAANNQGNVDLLNQVNQLRSEVTALRSQLEELQQQATQAKDSNRAQYLDLDGRLNRLESGVGTQQPATAAPAASAPAAATPSGARASTSVEPSPEVFGDPGLLAGAADERTAYETAFAALKSGRYAESAEAFQAFLGVYPSGTYAPNALYWLGESYYVTQNYALALEQFQSLFDRYPTHDKAPGALLKVGLAQYGLKDLAAAQATLARVSSRFPGTDAARTADDRRRAIELSAIR